LPREYRSKVPPNERSAISRANALKRWSKEDSRAATEPWRAGGPGRIEYWEREVDPEGKLEPSERRRRAERAKRAFYVDLRRKRTRKERAAREAREDGAVERRRRRGGPTEDPQREDDDGP
jgi:hypothetical protein